MNESAWETGHISMELYKFTIYIIQHRWPLRFCSSVNKLRPISEWGKAIQWSCVGVWYLDWYMFIYLNRFIQNDIWSMHQIATCWNCISRESPELLILLHTKQVLGFIFLYCLRMPCMNWIHINWKFNEKTQRLNLVKRLLLSHLN